MDNNNKPIEIFLRQCFHSPNSLLPNRNRPEWFSKNGCLINLMANTDRKLSNINLVYDEHFGKMQQYTNSGIYFDSEYTINAGTESGSFLKTLDIVMGKNLPDDTIIYFVEDDYLHVQGFCSVLQEAFVTLPVQYITLYDHLDKYIHYPDLSSKIFVTNSCHWRQTPSTCNTFACKMGQLRQDIETHKFFSVNGNGGVTRDHDKFIELGRLGRTLVSSIPGYSTHCDDYMSPVLDWSCINQKRNNFNN